MRGIKIPQYEFALKMQGGLMREWGRICRTLRYMIVFTLITSHAKCALTSQNGDGAPACVI